VLVFDPSAYTKKGSKSVGVQRQWCGRLGKIENCQVGIYLGSVARRDHALVDMRLYLPKEWANRQRRRKKAGVLAEVCFRTRHELMLEMLDEHGNVLPHTWIVGADELGRSSGFRQELRTRQNVICWRCCRTPKCTIWRRLLRPTWAGDAVPQFRSCMSIADVSVWPRALGRRSRFATVQKGPLITQALRRLMQARTEDKPSAAAQFLVEAIS
jgi:hypothetical protein